MTRSRAAAFDMPLQAERQPDIGEDRRPRHQRRLLEDEADLASAGGRRRRSGRPTASRSCRRSASPRPAMMRSAVDLPQPDGPSRLTNSPWPISSDMFCSATVPLEKTLETPRSETSGRAAAGAGCCRRQDCAYSRLLRLAPGRRRRRRCVLASRWRRRLRRPAAGPGAAACRRGARPTSSGPCRPSCRRTRSV